jgi:hypothetical protein
MVLNILNYVLFLKKFKTQEAAQIMSRITNLTPTQNNLS